MSEPKKFQEKLINFYSNYWNIITTIAVLGFIIGFVLRVHHETRIIGRIILAVDSVLWSVKLLDFLRFLELKRWHMFPNPEYFSVHAQFGPYITMAGKMVFQICMLIVYKMLHAKIQVMNMSSIVIMLCIALLAFGLARQSITYPDEEWHWLLLRNVFYKPYFMLYGEVYADEVTNVRSSTFIRNMQILDRFMWRRSLG
jgi:transient receptor potential cation channel subfamily M protein 3